MRGPQVLGTEVWFNALHLVLESCLLTLLEVTLELGVAVHCVILELGSLQQKDQEFKAL